MKPTMPATAQAALEWGWDQYAAHASALTQQTLTAGQLHCMACGLDAAGQPAR